MSYLDRLEKKNLDYIEAIGQARTAVEKAHAIRRLLPANASEARQEGLLEQTKRRNAYIAERQRAQEAGSPVASQDEDFLSMAPAETQIPMPQGMQAGNLNQGVSELKEILGGGGKQVRPGASGPVAPGAGQITTTETITGPTRNRSYTGSPIIDRLVRSAGRSSTGNPQFGTYTPTRTVTRTQRDPELFQTNVTGLAAALGAAQMSGDDSAYYRTVQQMSATYGQQYTMEAVQAAKMTHQTNQHMRMLQIPALTSGYQGEYDVSYAEANAMAQAEASGDYEKLGQLLGTKQPLTRQVKMAQLAASQQSLAAEKARTEYIRQQTIGQKISNQAANAQLNSVDLDTKLLGHSMAAGWLNRVSGGTGDVTPTVFFKELDSYTDEDGKLKPNAMIQAQGAQDYHLKKGGLLLFNTRAPEEEWSLGSGISEVFGGGKRGTVSVGIGDAASLFADAMQAQNEARQKRAAQTLEDLNLGKMEGGVFRFAHELDALHVNADPSRALAQYINDVLELGPDLALETRRGYRKQIMEVQREAVAPAPAEEPVEAPAQPPAKGVPIKPLDQGPLVPIIKRLLLRSQEAAREREAKRRRLLEEGYRRLGILVPERGGR